MRCFALFALVGLAACGGAPPPPEPSAWEAAPKELLPDAFVAGLDAAIATCSEPLHFLVDCTEAPCVVIYQQGGAQPASDCPGWRGFAGKGSGSWMYSQGGEACATAGMAPIWAAIDTPALKERAYVRAMAVGERLCASP